MSLKHIQHISHSYNSRACTLHTHIVIAIQDHYVVPEIRDFFPKILEFRDFPGIFIASLFCHHTVNVRTH